MDPGLGWTISGTAVSLASAAFSLWQAWRARRDASKAEVVLAQLVDHREASELAQLYSSCRKAQKSIEKYGPGAVPSTLVGVDHSRDAADVQEALVSVSESAVVLGAGGGEIVREFVEVLTPLLQTFARAGDTATLDLAMLQQSGTEMLGHVATVSATIKRKLEQKRERAH